MFSELYLGAGRVGSKLVLMFVLMVAGLKIDWFVITLFEMLGRTSTRKESHYAFYESIDLDCIGAVLRIGIRLFFIFIIAYCNNASWLSFYELDLLTEDNGRILELDSCFATAYTALKLV